MYLILNSRDMLALKQAGTDSFLGSRKLKIVSTGAAVVVLVVGANVVV